jgi:predicted phage terminase large subunit-like protein
MKYKSLVDPKNVNELECSELDALYGMQRKIYLDQLKDLIINHQRIDLLVTEVLKFELKPFHLQMLQFQIIHPNNLQLVFRGAGKSTMCTVAKAIWYMCAWPDVRIVIASKTIGQSQARLKEIKSILENNELLIEIFGEFYNKKIWNAREIEIAQRKSHDATPTIKCIGADGSSAGFHFDVEFSDDLIDKKNSWSDKTRDEVDEWYNSTFTPMLDPPDPKYPFRHHRHRVGTRYHYLDQYGRWIKRNEELIKAGEEPLMDVNIVPALHPVSGKSPWPERFSVKHLLKIKRAIGTIAFSAQYLNSTDAMKGEIFDIDDCQAVSWEDVVKPLYESGKMSTFMGVDLAISEKEEADDFAIVIIGKIVLDNKYRFYILDSYNGKLKFTQQTNKIVQMAKKWDCQGIGIDSVAYQKAQYQKLSEDYPELRKRLRAIIPKSNDDKVSRAWRITPIFEDKQVYFPEKEIKIGDERVMETPSWKLREQLLLFPSGDHDDLFDAMEYAFQMATKRIKRQEEYFGLL